MSYDTVNERRNAINIATFGMMAALFIPLTPDGTFSTDDSENALGFWIGLDVSTEVAGEGEIVSYTCTITRERSVTCTVNNEISETCEITKEISETCDITMEISATTLLDG